MKRKNRQNADAPHVDPLDAVDQKKPIIDLEKAVFKKIPIKPSLIVFALLLMASILGGVYLVQQSQMRDIEDEVAQKQAELDAMRVQMEQSERMLEFMQSDDYLIQYAREKLGMVFPSDYLFQSGSSATPAAAVQTPERTIEPVATPLATPEG